MRPGQLHSMSNLNRTKTLRGIHSGVGVVKVFFATSTQLLTTTSTQLLTTTSAQLLATASAQLLATTSAQFLAAPDVRREPQKIAPGTHLIEIYGDPVVETCEWGVVGRAVKVDVPRVARIRGSPVLVPVDCNRKASTHSRSFNLYHLRIGWQQRRAVTVHGGSTSANCGLKLLIEEA